MKNFHGQTCINETMHNLEIELVPEMEEAGLSCLIFRDLKVHHIGMEAETTALSHHSSKCSCSNTWRHKCKKRETSIITLFEPIYLMVITCFLSDLSDAITRHLAWIKQLYCIQRLTHSFSLHYPLPSKKWKTPNDCNLHTSRYIVYSHNGFTFMFRYIDITIFSHEIHFGLKKTRFKELISNLNR